MNTYWISNSLFYDGSQLRSLYAYLDHKIEGDSIVSWIGGCRVEPSEMVDGEDLNLNSKISGDKMLHFIVEIFGAELVTMVSLQRLFTCIVQDIIFDSTQNIRLSRSGDDLYLDNKKLSISIATVSPVSGLIHFAINVASTGAPVSILSLTDLGIDPQVLAEKAMKAFAEEFKSIRWATQKVRWVR